jgi:hypothetical protein
LLPLNPKYLSEIVQVKISGFISYLPIEFIDNSLFNSLPGSPGWSNMLLFNKAWTAGWPHCYLVSGSPYPPPAGWDTQCCAPPPLSWVKLSIPLCSHSERSAQSSTLPLPGRGELCSPFMVTNFLQEVQAAHQLHWTMWFPQGWVICCSHLAVLQVHSSGIGSAAAGCS